MLTNQQIDDKNSFIKELYSLMRRYNVSINEGDTDYENFDVWSFEGQCEKWRNIINKKLGRSANSLATLNDGLDPCVSFSHTEIGKFIDENREAIFKKGA